MISKSFKLYIKKSCKKDIISNTQQGFYLLSQHTLALNFMSAICFNKLRRSH